MRKIDKHYLHCKNTNCKQQLCTIYNDKTCSYCRYDFELFKKWLDIQLRIYNNPDKYSFDMQYMGSLATGHDNFSLNLTIFITDKKIKHWVVRWSKSFEKEKFDEMFEWVIYFNSLLKRKKQTHKIKAYYSFDYTGCAEIADKFVEYASKNNINLDTNDEKLKNY